jgi:DNA ligase-associated metallophosphoesterase
MSDIPGSLHLSLQGESLVLLPSKMIWWPKQGTLLLADTHFGKSGTFRQSGLGVPGGHDTHDFGRIGTALEQTRAGTCIILGDFFHSRTNQTWQLVTEWIRTLAGQIQLQLIPGNHDILTKNDYAAAGIHVLDPVHRVGPFSLVHDVHDPAAPGPGYRIGGHLHPGVRLHGNARQGLTLPCFWVTQDFAVMPAFGDFTGLARVAPSAGDRIFVALSDADVPCVVEIPV